MQDGILERWRDTFNRIDEGQRKAGEQIIWVIVDGFLLYWHPVSIAIIIHSYGVLKHSRSIPRRL